MVEVLHRGLGYTVECSRCDSVLKFHQDDMKYLNEEDAEYKTSPPERAHKVQYIICPVCGSKLFVKSDTAGWRLGVKRICKDTSTGKV